MCPLVNSVVTKPAIISMNPVETIELVAGFITTELTSGTPGTGSQPAPKLLWGRLAGGHDHHAGLCYVLQHAGEQQGWVVPAWKQD